MATVIDHPSRRFPHQPRPRRVQRAAPQGQGVEVVRLDRAVGDEVDALEDFAARQLRIDCALDPADEALIDADHVGELILRQVACLSPFRELHTDPPKLTDFGQWYDTASYFVNGHDDSKGAEYAAVAYILVMHPGNRIRELRKAAGLTQEQLAELTGYSQDRISNYENGRRPMRLAEMQVIARGLKCSAADLLDDKDNPDRLVDEERVLLDAFRKSPGEARQFLLKSALAVAGDGNDIAA